MTALRRDEVLNRRERRSGAACRQTRTAFARDGVLGHERAAVEVPIRPAKATWLLTLVLILLSLGAIGMGARGTSYAIDEFLRLRAEAAYGLGAATHGSFFPDIDWTPIRHADIVGPLP